jgi:hypothetical protein
MVRVSLHFHHIGIAISDIGPIAHISALTYFRTPHGQHGMFMYRPVAPPPRARPPRARARGPARRDRRRVAARVCDDTLSCMAGQRIQQPRKPAPAAAESETPFPLRNAKLFRVL